MTTPSLAPANAEAAADVADNAPVAALATTSQTPTEELAAEIAQALLAANLITSADLSRCTALLQNPAPDGGDWKLLFENQITPRTL